MAVPAAKLPHAPTGITSPRIAPPVPAKSLVNEWKAAAAELSIEPMAWQTLAARYLNARDGDRWLYPEVCFAVARQNGKTEILKPHVLQRLRMGRHILHTAQNRELPRDTFLEIAAELGGNPWVKSIRQANGQESITVHTDACDRSKRCKCKGGGKYTLVAPRPGVRGHGVDDVILDEVREQRSYELIAAIKPTMTASKDRQLIYLSNAGDADSVVLNDLRRRAERGDPRLAYLEWSSSPDRAREDREGWAEANPALGITIALDTLEDAYDSLPAEVFETEHLCRWVTSMQPRLVAAASWERCRGVIEGDPLNPSMAINMHPSGTRASAVLAWQQSDGRIALVEIAEATGTQGPIDVEALGKDLRALAAKHKVRNTAFASWTDADLARHLLNAKPLDGKEFANASEAFVRIVHSGRLIWESASHITDDLTWTARKPHESGAWQAVPAQEDHPITASLAAIRAVYLAAAPKSSGPQVF
jgi:hypothetical protein